MPRWKYKVNRRMKYYGDIDYDHKEIRLNPAKGDVINTAIHENLHKEYPDKPEKWIYRRATYLEKQLTIKEQINLLKKYL